MREKPSLAGLQHASKTCEQPRLDKAAARDAAHLSKSKSWLQICHVIRWIGTYYTNSTRYPVHFLNFFQMLKSLFSLGVFICLLVGPRLRCPASEIAFFYALDADLKTLKKQASSLGEPIKIGQRSIQRLQLGNHRVYAMKMGSGSVETAVSATTLLTRYRCDVAFSLGPVGTLTDLPLQSWHMVGDVVDYQKGIWDKSGFQMHPPARQQSSEDKTPPAAAFTLPKLPTLLDQAATERKLLIASGEIFVASSEFREQLFAQTKADAVDMNLFGLTAECAQIGVPLFSWRIISDRADADASATFRAFIEHYDGVGGEAVAQLIRDLPPNPNSPDSYLELKRLLAPDPTPEAR